MVVNKLICNYKSIFNIAKEVDLPVRRMMTNNIAHSMAVNK